MYSAEATMYPPPASPARYQPGVAVALGACRIACGGLAIGLQVPTTLLSVGTATVDISYSYAAAGVWCGIVFIITGSFGMSSGYKPSYCLVTTNIIMSAISATLFCTSLLILSGFALAEAFSIHEANGWGATDGLIPVIAMYGVLIVIAVFELVFEIVCSGLSCAAVCCCLPNAHVTPVQESNPGGKQAQNRSQVHSPSQIQATMRTKGVNTEDRWEDRNSMMLNIPNY